MPLPNRVDPFGNLFADASRGLLFGNRGGRFHRDGRPSALDAGSRADGFVAASTSKDGTETFGAAGYTELFFLDEPTALAAGHRPCFECRRADAQAFAAAFARGHCHVARTRSIACCTHNGSTGGPSAGTGARSTACPTAVLSPWRTSLAAPGPSAALRCCDGHPADTPRRMRVRAVLWLTFSHRRAPWPRWRAAIDHAGTRARMRGRSSQRQVTPACAALGIRSRSLVAPAVRIAFSISRPHFSRNVGAGQGLGRSTRARASNRLIGIVDMVTRPAGTGMQAAQRHVRRGGTA